MASRKKTGKKQAAKKRFRAGPQISQNAALIKRLLVIVRTRWFEELFGQHLHIICLMPDGADSVPTLSRVRGDAVAWKNKDTIAHTFSFVGPCPLEGFTSLTLDPGSNSRAYKVKPGTTIKRYTYTVEPPFSDGPPGEPAMDVGE